MDKKTIRRRPYRPNLGPSQEDLIERRDSTSEQYMTKPPVILLKPPARKNLDDEDEEWPTVGKSASSTRPRPAVVLAPHSRTHSPLMSGAKSDQLRDLYSGGGASSSSGPVSPAVMVAEGPGPSSQSQNPLKHAADFGAYNKSSAKTLRGGVPLVAENMEWTDFVSEYLDDQNTNFLVVGVIGPQGCGKSTLLSMIGGNDAFDMYRHYIFRPASKECTETSCHQTAGIQIYVTDNRVILLDSQPILSSSALNFLLQNERRYSYDWSTFENYVEIESLQITAFLLQVCHVVIVLFDWFIDSSLLQFLYTAEMLKPSLPLSEGVVNVDYYPHLIFVQNRAKREDYNFSVVQRKCQFLATAMKDSNLRWKYTLNVKSCMLNDCEIDDEGVNFFILPDMKPRGYKQEIHSSYKGVPDYEVLVKKLRSHVMSLPPLFCSSTVQTEKQWIHFSARMWDMTRKSHLISEYGRMLP